MQRGDPHRTYKITNQPRTAREILLPTPHALLRHKTLLLPKQIRGGLTRFMIMPSKIHSPRDPGILNGYQPLLRQTIMPPLLRVFMSYVILTFLLRLMMTNA
jgi:hypothetical protein